MTSCAAWRGVSSTTRPGGRDGKCVYLTNAIFTPWDAQFYPDGIRGWMTKLDTKPEGGLAFDPHFLVEFPDGQRPHQVRLQGGDSTSDSFR